MKKYFVDHRVFYITFDCILDTPCSTQVCIDVHKCIYVYTYLSTMPIWPTADYYRNGISSYMYGGDGWFVLYFSSFVNSNLLLSYTRIVFGHYIVLVYYMHSALIYFIGYAVIENTKHKIIVKIHIPECVRNILSGQDKFRNLNLTH